VGRCDGHPRREARRASDFALAGIDASVAAGSLAQGARIEITSLALARRLDSETGNRFGESEDG
jgi:hypothetical protein